MSEERVSLGGYNLKDISVIILVLILAVAVAVFVVGLALAIYHGGANSITFTGDIDVGQFTGIIIAIAAIATTLISQQLISRIQSTATKQADDAWLESEKNTANKPD